MVDLSYTSMKAKDVAEGSTSSTEINMYPAIDDSDVSPIDANHLDAGSLSHEQREPDQCIPASNSCKVIAMVQMLWRVITVNLREFLRIDQLSQYHGQTDVTRDTSTKGFAPGAYAAGDRKKAVSDTIRDPPRTLATEEQTTDHGADLQRARQRAFSRNKIRASKVYKACHRKFASLSQAAYKTRLHPPKVVAKLTKPFFLFSGKRLSHASKPDGHQMWAVLIGIDGYKNPLRGCVADAHMFEEYLINVLHIPKEQIQCLLGNRPYDSSTHVPYEKSHPTRTNIIDTLLGLSTNPKINKGDSIIIYFSGHGSSYYCPDCYSTIFQSPAAGSSAEAKLAKTCFQHRCPIEALCPIDRDTPDTQGTGIPDISDREINNILTHIYDAKDARITVILDCCHGGGTTRAPFSGTARTTESLPYGSFIRMLDAAKERMGDWDGYRDVWAEDWIPNMDSHVVLAACKDYQFAREWKDKNGYSGCSPRRS
ncbi:caspase domain-containing protein [Armillaria luteobubalina]|uniref:Caspase domain-containing protein n=1 Tax=Armillaria luteobubalina TaxID=153913 RepID=A0AA39TAJ3_9AGAR|nr:caspase domain-containing protein [Armillaria luteobubalina]